MTDPIARLNAALEGRYRIEREIGEGGMATVYLAHDERHNRNVALKVLKAELAAVVGAERFLAEIETTAKLTHPHILPLHDSGEADGFLFFVAPYIEGDTLRDKIEREKQLSIEEALDITKKVASALDYAHEHGVVHRDIKPGNILLSAKGEPTVADFGIALAVAQAGGGRVTETGLSVGTPHYMSPEQATGDRDVDPRTDVYALGSVLYEMLTGEPPYLGTTAQAVLAKILTDPAPAPTKVRLSIPPNVDAATRKALEKLPADRFPSAQEFAGALADVGFRHGEEAEVRVGAGQGLWNPLSMAGYALALVFALAFGWSLSRSESPLPVERFSVPFLPGQEPVYTGDAGYDLSPDGRMLVYRDDLAEGQVLVVRRWDDLTAAPVRETLGGSNPAVSFDGLEVAFEQGEEIKVLAFSGGPVRTLVRGSDPEWGPDGVVYATADSGAIRVPATGGTVEYVSRLAEGEQAHFVRDVLPGGRSALLEVQHGGSEPSEIRGLDLGSGEMTPIVFGLWARYLPSGHLVYNSGDGTMMAARFDPGRMELLGTPVAVMDGLNFWSLADDGKLFYSAGTAGGLWQLSWTTRSGQVTPVDPSWTFQRGVGVGQRWSISPGGSMVALREFTSAAGYDIWVKLLETGPHTRLTFDDARDYMPVWEPSGQAVTFLSDRNGNFDVWSRRADGTGEAELILDIDENVAMIDWSPDGEWLLLTTDLASQTQDGGILSFGPGVDSEPTPLFVTEFAEVDPAVSPDGRWIAYASNETGRFEVFVTPFPAVETGRWQVSIDGGRNPQWGSNGQELFFERGTPNAPMMVVDVEAASNFVAGTPRVLFEDNGRWMGAGQTGNLYDVAPDDQRFLVASPPNLLGSGGQIDGGVLSNVVLVNNFFEELRQVVPER